ncbi:hypothetical protein pb186bvf_004514 [Paramecium bursaria]
MLCKAALIIIYIYQNLFGSLRNKKSKSKVFLTHLIYDTIINIGNTLNILQIILYYIFMKKIMHQTHKQQQQGFKDILI